MYARLKTFRKVFLDDGLVLFAWLLLLIMSILLQVGEDDMYLEYAISAGKAPATPENLSRVSGYLHISLTVDILIITCIWTVKFSLLAFFWRLGQKVQGQKIVWWIITSITLVTYFISIGILPYHCDLDSIYEISGQWAVQKQVVAC